MWVNHHHMFSYIRRIDTRFMFLNGFLLLTVVLNPFTTSLVADHLLDSDASAAAAVYSGVFVFLSVFWNLTWRYASTHNLLAGSIPGDQAKRVGRDFDIGTLLYVAAFVLAFVNGILSIVAILGLAVFWAVTAPSRGGK
jgi:uncharacterized membrane protein